MQLGVSEKRIRGFCIPVRVYSVQRRSSNTDWIMVATRAVRFNESQNCVDESAKLPRCRARRPYREEYRAGNTGGFVVFMQQCVAKSGAERLRIYFYHSLSFSVFPIVSSFNPPREP